MYFVIFIVLISISARGISQIYSYEPRQERFDRPIANPTLERNPRDKYENVNFDRQHEHMNLNHEFHSNNNDRSWNQNPNEDRYQNHFNNQRQFSEQNNRDLIPSNRNEGNINGSPNQDPPYRQPDNRELVSNDRNDRGWMNNQERSDRGFISSNRNDRSRYGRPNEELPRGQFREPNNRESVPEAWNGHPNPDQSCANLNNHEQFNGQNNRRLSGSDTNYNTQGRSHDITGNMDINMPFDGPNNQNRREHGNFNMPRQSFNINTEYSNKDITNNRSISRSDNRNDKYNQNILHARRQQDEMTDYNRETQNSNHRNSPESYDGIVSFLNNLNNNTNQNRNNQSTNNNRRHSGFRQSDQRPKTVIENEVTENPINNEDGNRTKDKWVWGVEETTTMIPVTLDDRAAFSGDNCPTGYARYRGKCVPQD